MPKNQSFSQEDRVPVIVGVGEIVDRPKEIAKGLEPLALLLEALKRAEADSGAKLLGEIDSLDIVNFLSWRYRDPEKQLAARLSINPKHNYYGPVGGESPIRYLAKVRLGQAAGYLATSDLSLEAIAVRTGYASNASLSKAFKREFGASPGQYREGGGPVVVTQQAGTS